MFDNYGQTEFFESFDLIWNGAEDCADRPTLVEQVGTKARQAFDAERKVEFQVLFETMLLRVSQY